MEPGIVEEDFRLENEESCGSPEDYSADCLIESCGRTGQNVNLIPNVSCGRLHSPHCLQCNGLRTLSLYEKITHYFGSPMQKQKDTSGHHNNLLQRGAQYNFTVDKWLRVLSETSLINLAKSTSAQSILVETSL